MIRNVQEALWAGSRLVALAATVCSIAGALAPRGTPDPAQPEQQSQSDGPTDQERCALAGLPGPMHERLARAAGTWDGRVTMWLDPTPGSPEVEGGCTWTVTPLFDGRYVRAELAAELPGMGAFNGLGLAGFDNVSGEFVSDWIDDHSTGIMRGAGALSEDGSTLSWTYEYNCPIRGVPATVRQVETFRADDELTFEMFATDPGSGVEFRCMRIEYTRRP